MECGVRVMGSQGGAVAIGLSGRWGIEVGGVVRVVWVVRVVGAVRVVE